MKWSGQHIYDLVSKFRNTVDFSEDVTFYQPVNNANPAISIGSSDDERFRILVNYQGTTTQVAQTISFKTFTEGGAANDGKFAFIPDEVHVLTIDDGGIDFEANFGISINGTDILTDSSGTATLSNIDALDATTVSTLNAALTAGDITGVTAGTGLSGGGTSGAVTLNVDAAQTQITSVGTIGTGTWQGTAIASAYLDADMARLSGTQTFTGAKTFTENPVVFDGDKTVTPGDGAFIHQDTAIITDGNTSASGTAAIFSAVNIEGARLAATNSSVTTTAAASLYIKNAPSASTNQTITNAYALWVDAGLVKFDGALTVDGTITGDVTGNVTGSATTAGTVTTAAQPAIESIGTDGDTLAILADTLLMSNTTADTPVIKLVNTTNDHQAGQLIFEKLRDDNAVDQYQNLGEIWFRGQDSAQNTEDYAYILGEIDVSTSGQESGILKLGLANHDGGNGPGLILTGGSENDEIDVTLGFGANSVVTVPGSIAGDVTGDLTGTADVATVATTVTITDNEDTDEDNAIVFTAGGDVDGGNIGLESDGTLTYNPSDGKVTATGFVGALTGQADTVATIAGLAPNTATTQATQGNITTLAGLTSFGAAGATTNIVAGDVTMYNPVNNGHPSFSIGATATERLNIQASYDTGTQTLGRVSFTTHTASAEDDFGDFLFNVDEVNKFTINDSGVIVTGDCKIAESNSFKVGTNAIISDSSGTATLSNIDALDATTKTTIATTVDAATATATGVVELATTAEAVTGTDTARAVTTAGVAAVHATTQTGKNYRIINTSFRQDIGTTKYYVPLKSQAEQTSLTREEATELAVCDGRLVSATVRVENMQGTTGDFTLTMGVETNVVNATYTDFSGTAETEALTVNTGDDHHVFHFVFGTDPHWSATDMFAVSIQSSSDEWGNSERFFVTLVVEDDWATYLAGSSREIDSTP